MAENSHPNRKATTHVLLYLILFAFHFDMFSIRTIISQETELIGFIFSKREDIRLNAKREEETNMNPIIIWKILLY